MPVGEVTLADFKAAVHCELNEWTWWPRLQDLIRDLQAIERGAGATRERSPLGRNIDMYRTRCGWTFEDLAATVGIGKNAVNTHINHGIQPQAGTLKAYADAFSKALGGTITVEDLQRE